MWFRADYIQYLHVGRVGKYIAGGRGRLHVKVPMIGGLAIRYDRDDDRMGVPDVL
jgi:hypothetical protein